MNNLRVKMNNNRSPRIRSKHKKAEPVTVKYKSEIRGICNRFMPSSEDQVRKLLETGMTEIKNRYTLQEEQENLDESKFGKFQPLKINNIEAQHWVDKLIEERMGAKREGLLVVWYLKDGKHSFDPFTGEIEYEICDS